MTNLDAKKSRLVTSILAIIFSIVIGCILGGLSDFVIKTMYAEGWKVTWHSLGTPPEPAEKIIAANYDTIEVQSAQGQNFIFSSGEWKKSDVTLENWNDPNCKINASFASPPPLPIKDSWEGDYCGWGGRHIEFAILEGGSVWQWIGPGRYDYIPGLEGATIGMVAGFILWLAIKVIPLVMQLLKNKK